MTRKEQSAAFLRPFLSYRSPPFSVWDKDRKMQFGEESYEQTTDDQTAVERKANGKQPLQNGKQNTVELLSQTKKYSPLYFVPKFSGLCEAFNQEITGGKNYKLLSLSHGEVSQDGHCARRK